MTITRRGLLGTAAAGAALPLVRARAAATPTLKIGVLNDQSGPYKDLAGLGSVTCVKQAIQDFGPHGFNVEVVSADHQNKPDIGAGIARRWIDEDHVTLIDCVDTSSVALAVNNVCREKNVAYLNTGAGTDDLTGKDCTPVTLHWSYDIYMLAKSTGGKTVETGGKTWYFITANYAFGQQLQQVTTGFVKAAGGQVLGASPYPFPATTDFSSFLLSAQASGAKVLGLANAGADTVNCIKQAAEFGLPRKMTLAALLMFITDVHGVGLQTAQGLYLTESFYWNMNDGTRRFAKKVQPKLANHAMPTMVQAGDYAGTLHYLKAANAIGAAHAQKDGAAAVAQMKKMPTDDDCFGKRHIRADGLFITDSYLFRVKKPSESKEPWDYFSLVGTTPAEEAFEPPDPACKLNKS